MEFDIKMINSLIKNRRSIFTSQFTGEEVDDDIINLMMENANWAPTHKFTEPWRFMIFKGEGRQKLANFQSGLYKKMTEADGTFRQKRFENLKQKPFECSHVITIGMSRDPEKRVPEIEEITAVGCAIQNMYLTATAHGIGCYLSTGGITYFEGAKDFFGLHDEDILIGFMFVGVPSSWPKGSVRSNTSEKAKWVKN